MRAKGSERCFSGTFVAGDSLRLTASDLGVFSDVTGNPRQKW
jgi:hypothetical protein